MKMCVENQSDVDKAETAVLGSDTLLNQNILNHNYILMYTNW